ncbi:hypothetical protein TNCV_2101781 [Trichonephila clavipes]|nr:hypothetical protein TNCV_2101781 [Trichonephila clavipes]
MRIEALSTAHIGQKNDHDIFSLTLLERELLKSRENVGAYRNCGSYHSIAAGVGLDPVTVSIIWNRWVQDGNTERHVGSQRFPSLAAEKTGMLPT